MLSNKPYLLRAFHNWIVDSKCTPYVMLDAEFEKVDVPQEYVQEGKIVLNVSPGAIQDLQITNKYLYFRASFSGIEQEIYAPMGAVMAVYAMENGRGMVFDEENEGDEDFFEDDADGDNDGAGGKGLHIVK